MSGCVQSASNMAWSIISTYVLAAVLVHACWDKKYHRLGGLSTTDMYSSQFWELEGQIRVRTLFQPAVCQLLSVCSQGRQGVGALWGLFYQGTNPIHVGPTFLT